MAKLRYIHELKTRNSAFLVVGYWVIEEIQRAKSLGLDWKTDYDKLRYSDDLYTLAYMLDHYEKVEIQESRNGYLFDKAQVEAGYPYYHYDFNESNPTPEPEPDPDPEPEPDPDPQPEPSDSAVVFNPFVLTVM